MTTLHGEPIEVCDKVFDIIFGWGTVIGIPKTNNLYVIEVKFKNGEYATFTTCGKYKINDLTPRLYWSEPKIEIPKKPIKKKKALWAYNGHMNMICFSEYKCTEEQAVYRYGSTATMIPGTEEEI